MNNLNLEIDHVLMVDCLSQHEAIIIPILDLQPYDQIVIAAYLIGQLSAQLPITSSAFVEAMGYFKERTGDMLEDYYDKVDPYDVDTNDPNLEHMNRGDEETIMQFMPTSYKDFSNQTEVENINNDVNVINNKDLN